MRIVAGLGNPGAGYAAHRHNVGFMLVDALATQYGFDAWKAKFQGMMAEGAISEAKTILFKPQKFMNDSGTPIKTILKFYKLPPSNLIVIHDDIDLAAGKLRIKCGGGHGGHNGLRDIDKHIGTDYWRVRIGVGRSRHGIDTYNHVLSNFDAEDKLWLTPLLDALAHEWGLWEARGADALMATIAQKNPPPQKTTKATTKATNGDKDGL